MLSRLWLLISILWAAFWIIGLLSLEGGGLQSRATFALFIPMPWLIKYAVIWVIRGRRPTY